jgi:hypothetical protein
MQITKPAVAMVSGLASAPGSSEDIVSLIAFLAMAGLFILFSRTQPLRPYFKTASRVTPFFSGSSLAIWLILLTTIPLYPGLLPLPLPVLGPDWGETLSTSPIGNQIAGAITSAILSPVFLLPSSWFTAAMALWVGISLVWTKPAIDENGQLEPDAPRVGLWGPVFLLLFHTVHLLAAATGSAAWFTGHWVTAFLSLWGKSLVVLVFFLYLCRVWHQSATKATKADRNEEADPNEIAIPGQPRDAAIPIIPLTLPALAFAFVQTLLNAPGSPGAQGSLPLLQILPAYTLMLLTMPLPVLLHTRASSLIPLLSRCAALLVRGFPSLFWFGLATSVYWLFFHVSAQLINTHTGSIVPNKVVDWLMTALSSILAFRLSAAWFFLLLPLAEPPQRISKGNP